MRLIGSVALLLALSCTRSFDLPSAAPLAVTPSFDSVAPREARALVASGGAGKYTFAFAKGGKLSGADATVEAATGAYQAGALGSAQDVIEVMDAAGAQVQARISVGQRLFISPASTEIAPGGHVLFSATGGKPPYQFALTDGTASMTIGAKNGFLFAGTDGNVRVHVTLQDQTADAAAIDTALVIVGAPLKLFAPGKDALTPFGAIDLIATGGQPTYKFSLAGNSGGSVDAATGHYLAGAAGGTGVQDIVTVTDVFAQTDSVTLKPGPPLSASISSTDLHPGLPVEVMATGGKPPYSFAFDSRGDRSNGQVDAITGLYTPGRNFGATDLIVVHDATPGGLASASASGTAVGPERWSGLRAARRFTADLDGDGRQDLLSVTPYPSDPAGMLETRLVPPAGPIVAQYHFQQLYDAAAIDLNGDGHADVAMVQGSAFRVVLTNPDGSLGLGTPIAARVPCAGASCAVLDKAVLAWGAEPATATPTKESFFYTDYTGGGLVTAVGGGAFCTTTTGIMRVDWPLRGSAASTATCALNFTFKTPPAGLLTFAAADLNLDGNLDLAWIDSSDTTHLRYSLGPAFSSVVTLSFGSYQGNFVGFFQSGNGNVEQQMLPFAHAAHSGLLVALQAGTRRGVEEIIASASGPTVSAFYDPTGPSGPVVWGALSLDAANQFLSFNRLSGTLQAFDTNFAPLSSPPTVPFDVDTAVAGDFNGDSAPDLLLGNTVLGLADLVPGQGAGSFGQRPRLTGVSLPFQLDDIDGDGVRDIVTAGSGSALQVIFRTGTQFAYGPLTAANVSGAATMTMAKFSPGSSGPRDAVYQQGDGTIVYAAGHADGTFDAPVTMSQTDGTIVYSQWTNMRAANFGDGPSQDLWARVAATNTALLHDPSNAGVLKVGPSAPPRSGTCFPTSADIDGNGTSDIVIGCGTNAATGATVEISSTTGSKANLIFSSWIPLYTSPDSGTVVAICQSGANQAIVFTGREMVAISWNGSNPTSTASPLGAWSATAQVTRVACGARINADALLDVALVDSANKLHLYFATAPDAFVEGAAPLLPATSVFGLENTAGGPADLLLLPPGSISDFTVLLNAGDGTFP